MRLSAAVISLYGFVTLLKSLQTSTSYSYDPVIRVPFTPFPESPAVAAAWAAEATALSKSADEGCKYRGSPASEGWQLKYAVAWSNLLCPFFGCAMVPGGHKRATLSREAAKITCAVGYVWDRE